MPKKKNKKFKAQAKQEIRSTSQLVNKSTVINNAQTNELVNEPAVTSDEITILNEKYAYVRKDVTKLLITIGVLAALFVGFYFLGTHTNTLSSAGNWIYKVTNIQIQ